MKGGIALCCLAMFLLDCSRHGHRRVERGSFTHKGVATARQQQTSINPARSRSCLPPSFRDLVAAADPSVVQVRIRQEKPSRSGRRKLTREGLGSAFVYDATGLMLTNHHVVVDASEIRVVYKDGHDAPAEIVGSDPPTDVAVLRVKEHGLPALTLGNSDDLQVGDWVVAIGNPFGLSHTVSAGIVSARGRTIRELEGLSDTNGYFDFLQTDASINPGNSGGPLIDIDGHVVGICAAMRARSNKIGFAIPINMVRELIPALVSQGHIRRSALGVKVDSILADDIRRLGLSEASGAIVRAVQPRSGAEKAGFRVDDIVIEFEGQPIPGPERLRWLASMAGVSKRITVKVQRRGALLELAAVLGELPPISSSPIDELDEEDE